MTGVERDGAGVERDRQMMAIALRLAQRGLGTTAPNPAVGALVVDEATGEVIARGWTQPGGRPHAEPEALARAGARARGATMYVTLEPCSHFGKTPPCADAVIAAGIGRVVCAIEDPDPRVAGRGLQRLREAGIAVTRGVAAREAHWVTRGHIVRVTERRPFVQIKMALGAEGEVARGAAGRPVWVTGSEARAMGHLLRARADAILVGRRTVEDDDPELTCRLPGLQDRSPRPVVLASEATVPWGCKLVEQACRRGLRVFCGPHPSPDAVARLTEAGARVTPVAAIDGGLWLPAVAEHLVADGVTRLLVEGGPSMWRAFARAGLFDEVVMFHHRPAGCARLPLAMAQAALKRHIGATTLALADQRALGDDDMIVFRPPAFAVAGALAT